MQNRLIKYGKLLLVVLYIIYVSNVIINVVFLQKGVTNGMTENGGASGYIITYGLSLLMASGFFIVPTAIQCVIYHAVKKDSTKFFVPSIVLEVIKLIGTAVYIYLIDLANLPSASPAQAAFIVTGIIVFIITVSVETVLLAAMKLEVK